MNLWRRRLELSLKKSAQDPASRFFQLATVDQHGLPHNRTLVFRQFDERIHDILYVVTDIRSQKWAQLAHQPKGAICWYFSDSREQYRLSCDIQQHSSDTQLPIISTLWKELSKPTQSSFYGATPGSKIDEASIVEETTVGNIPDSFGVLEIDIYRVDYLLIACQPHYRELHRRLERGDWEVQQLQP